MNFVFLSPHFPPNYYRFAVALKNLSIMVVADLESMDIFGRAHTEPPFPSQSKRLSRQAPLFKRIGRISPHTFPSR